MPSRRSLRFALRVATTAAQPCQRQLSLEFGLLSFLSVPSADLVVDSFTVLRACGGSTCAVIPKSMQCNTSTMTHDSSKPMTTLNSGGTGPSLREELGHVSCVRPPGGPALSPTAVQRRPPTVFVALNLQHILPAAFQYGNLKTEAQELPVATDLDQASAPPFGHIAPSTWHLVATPVLDLTESPRARRSSTN